MKKSIIVLITLASSLSLANPTYDTTDVKVSIEHALLQTEVACITKYHPQSEGEESAELFFLSEYSSVPDLEKNGYRYSMTLANGQKCSNGQDSSMPHIAVGLYDKNSEIAKRINESNAFVKGKVIFYKRSQAKDDFSKAFSKAINDLRD